MSMLSAQIDKLNPVLAQNNTTNEKIEELIELHAFYAGMSGFASGILPGVAGIIAALSSAGVIWNMYYRICRTLNIKITKNALKALSSAVLTNISTQLLGVLAISLATSWVPGVAVAATSVTCYGITYLAGYIFITLLTNVFKAGKNPDEMSEAELVAAGKAASKEVNGKKVFEAAREQGKERLKNGEMAAENVTISEE